MKKYILRLVVFVLLMVGNVGFAFNPSDIVYHNEKIMYDVDNAVWSDTIVKPEKKKVVNQVDDSLSGSEDGDIDDQTDQSMSLNTITLTKKMSSNIYKTTNLMLDKKQIAATLTSNYEFLKDGKLIAVDNNNLKYYQVIYEDEQFVQVLLSDEELKSIFPKAEIVKISQIENDKITVTRPFFKSKTLLLVNDTDRQFFKYSYKHPRVQFCDVKGLIKSYKYETITFSHYGDEQGALTIVITR